MSEMLLLAVLLLLSATNAFDGKDNLDPSKTILWGPGLNPENVTMRARYFFLQLYDTQGQKLVSFMIEVSQRIFSLRQKSVDFLFWF